MRRVRISKSYPAEERSEKAAETEEATPEREGVPQVPADPGTAVPDAAAAGTKIKAQGDSVPRITDAETEMNTETFLTAGGKTIPAAAAPGMTETVRGAQNQL